MKPNISRPLVTMMLLTLSAALTGCGMDHNASTDVAGNAIAGHLFGGQQPVQGANIYLYQAGTTGDGTGASNLLKQPVVTLADGSFILTGDYNRCPASNTQVYIVASGGNPGLAANTNNTASVMMAALGDCGNLNSNTYTYINEVTTAAAAWALAQFLGPNGNVGASPSNANGLRNAFLVANNLVNTTTGQAGGTSLPTGATFESRKLYSLANALSACVNTAGGSACNTLFSAATVNRVVPANTLDAALAIVRNPIAQIANVYSASTSSPPFPAALTVAPHDWSMSISYTGGGMASPTGVAVDSTGAVWVSNYFGAVASKFSATGVPASATGYADPGLNESFTVAIDTQDSAWITNEQSPYAVNTGYGTLSKFSSGGLLLSGSGFTSTIYFPYAIAGDSNGEMWVADYGHSQASLLNLSGTSLIGNGYTSSQLPLPLGVAIDVSHNAWFSGEGSVDRVTPGGSITEYPCCSAASALAIDQSGNVWASDYLGSAVIELNSGGTVLQRLTSGGVVNPEHMAVDGAGSLWVADYHGNTITGFGAASGGAASAVLSPSYGLGLDAGLFEPFAVAADASGNLWVTSFAGGTLTQFVGLVAPVQTPLLGPPQQP